MAASKTVSLRQRVPPTGAGGRGEGGVHVDVRRARQVPGGVLVEPGGSAAHPVAHVEDGHRAEQSGHLVDVDQRARRLNAAPCAA